MASSHPVSSAPRYTDIELENEDVAFIDDPGRQSRSFCTDMEPCACASRRVRLFVPLRGTGTGTNNLLLYDQLEQGTFNGRFSSCKTRWSASAGPSTRTGS